MVVLVGARRALLRDARPEKSRVCTKPSSVLAERKLLMRLDGVCRHYLAMTKSALFLFTGGGKFNRGTRKKKKHLKTGFNDSGAIFLSLFFSTAFSFASPFSFSLLSCKVTLTFTHGGLNHYTAPLTHFQDVARTGRRYISV